MFSGGGTTTIGYSPTTTTTENVSAKPVGPFHSSNHKNNHHISGAATTSFLATSRMHLVDTWRESFMNRSYEKHVSQKSTRYYF